VVLSLGLRDKLRFTMGERDVSASEYLQFTIFVSRMYGCGVLVCHSASYREWSKIAAAVIYVHVKVSGIYTLLAGRT
jgi:hypothetical protein